MNSFPTFATPELTLRSGWPRLPPAFLIWFYKPCLNRQRWGIIAGHARVLASRKLGLARIPVIVIGHLTEIQKRAYVIAEQPPRWQAPTPHRERQSRKDFGKFLNEV